MSSRRQEALRGEVRSLESILEPNRLELDALRAELSERRNGSAAGGAASGGNSQVDERSRAAELEKLFLELQATLDLSKTDFWV